MINFSIKKIVYEFKEMEAEIIAPITKSPLDSARGRGKARSIRRCTPVNKPVVVDQFKCGPTKVRIIIQNETHQLVECNGK
jgi:hypothetical protein